MHGGAADAVLAVQGARRGQAKRTTFDDPAAARAKDLVGRDFAALATRQPSHGTGKASRFWLAWFITMMPAASTPRCGSLNARTVSTRRWVPLGMPTTILWLSPSMACIRRNWSSCDVRGATPPKSPLRPPHTSIGSTNRRLYEYCGGRADQCASGSASQSPRKSDTTTTRSTSRRTSSCCLLHSDYYAFPPAATRRAVHRIVTALAEVTTLVSGRRLPAVTETRLNRRYQPALRLARLVLAGRSVEQPPGDLDATGFVFDLNRVFEEWLTVVWARHCAAGSAGGSRRASPAPRRARRHRDAARHHLVVRGALPRRH